VASNTTRSRDRLEALGYAVDVVESWNAFTKRRKDLYGGFDLIACGPDGVVFLQTTSRGNISSRARKIAELPCIDAIRKAGVHLWVDGWDQPDGPRTKWRVKTVDVS
jgi:hypothetical protein